MVTHAESNKSLKGHKLLILGPWQVPPPSEQIAHLQILFPELAIAVHKQQWTSSFNSEEDQEGLWKDVTVLVTQGALPEATQTPHLEYVQLWTAGAEQVLNNPTFHDTNISFCTASGVHG